MPPRGEPRGLPCAWLVAVALGVGCKDPSPTPKSATQDTGVSTGDPSQEPCNPLDPQSSPDAQETCDGLDNDCDGRIDEGLLQVWYLDSDGDGAGSDTYTAACAAPGPDWLRNSTDCDDADPGLNTSDRDDDGVSTCAGDCEDDNPQVYKGGPEACDGQDNDCDGQVDEWCDWEANTMHAGWGPEAGSYDCVGRWQTTSDHAYADTPFCAGCLYNFDLQWSLDTDSAMGDCGPLLQDMNLGFVPDYYGYGSALVYNAYSTTYIWSWADWNRYSPTLAFWWGSEDHPYYSYTADTVEWRYGQVEVRGPYGW